MKTLRWLWIAMLLVTVASAAPRDAQWQAVREDVDKGLPRSAIEKLEPLITEALHDDAYAEATRGLGWKILLESEIQGGSLEERILRLESLLPEMPREMHPVLNALAARWYWLYFQRYRYRFSQRTRGAAGDDLRTWDLPRILQEIESRFRLALEDPEPLQATPIHEWDELLEEGDAPDRLRPTLYDFIVHQALEFHAAGEQGAVVAEDAFRISPDSPLFDPVQDFLRWQPPQADGTQPILSSIRLFQQLLAFHADDTDSTAFLEADLDRLEYAHNVVAGERKHARYKAALRTFVERTPGHPSMARALALWATQVFAEGDKLEAHTLARRGVEAFPDSWGGRSCQILIGQIEYQQAHITTERVWTEPWPDIEVRYANITRLFLRAVPFTYEPEPMKPPVGPTLDRSRLRAVLSRQPAKTWSVALPPTPDYALRRERFQVPTDLAPGSYWVLASHDSSFSENDNQISWVEVWVSDLAIVVQSDPGPVVRGHILEARSGRPIQGARVKYWVARDGIVTGEAVSDPEGRFRIGVSGQVYLVATRGRQRLGLAPNIHDRFPPLGLRVRTMLFTDRSIYRPGQTIYYKGVQLRRPASGDNFEIVPGAQVTVEFLDANGKLIRRETHTTNDHGSFHGAFVAPRDRLPGRMRLTSGDGGTSIRVEEYKRPSFHVEVHPPDEAVSLGTRVTVKARATTFSGAPVGDAEVRWHVRRNSWLMRSWFRGSGSMSGAQLTHGFARTDASGEVSISFVAQPDPDFALEDNPIFRFAVHVDVIDGAGETRSEETSIAVGYTALQAHLGLDTWQTIDAPVAFDIRTLSMDGRPVPARGSIEVFHLEQPESVVRPPAQGPGFRYSWSRWNARPEDDPSRIVAWETGDRAVADSFATDASGRAPFSASLPEGAYRAILTTQDAFGRPVETRRAFHVVDPRARRFAVTVPDFLESPSWTVEPGEDFTALWGTGYPEGRACVEIVHRGRVLQHFWTRRGRTQQLIRQEITEDMRGGIVLRVLYVRENRAYVEQRIIDVPWSNKKLAITWERFHSRLEPGGTETWMARIQDRDSLAAVAEMVAVLYDASLDEIQPHTWRRFDFFSHASQRRQVFFANRQADLALGIEGPRPGWIRPRTFRSFPREFLSLYGILSVRRALPVSVNAGTAGPSGQTQAMHVRGGRGDVPMEAEIGVPSMASTSSELVPRSTGVDPGVGGAGPGTAPDLSHVVARGNLSETAFFYPDLRSDADGRVRLEFRMPEALTNWTFMAFAHDKQLRNGFLQDRAFTSKDFMVETNPPRFVREGDAIEFTARVSNRSDHDLTASVRLTMSNARSGAAVDAALGNRDADRRIAVPAGESRVVAWRLQIPDGSGFLTYRVVGTASPGAPDSGAPDSGTPDSGTPTTLSDGEEGWLPVLSRRVLVTESMSLPIRGKGSRSFRFRRLLESGGSSTLQNQSLTVQMVSQPAWYAVMALPYLMQDHYASSDAIFAQLYANSLGYHIAHSDPRIRHIFDQWKNTAALDSPLEKNNEIKAVLLEETPWVRQAESESQARRRVGLLFDANRLSSQTGSALARLGAMQEMGLWPWFPGGRPSETLTLRIITGFGRLRHLGVEVDITLARQALQPLDAWMDGAYRMIREEDRDDRHIGPNMALYLYGRSFFLQDVPVDARYREALDYWMDQARESWLQLGRQSQAHVALGLQRFGDDDTPGAIVASLEERSVRDDEMGMYWRDTENTWWWYRAPIETQAMMIEAFSEITQDDDAVEACRVWLLKQKQTQNWTTTRATVDAVYALLLRGASLLSSSELVTVELAGSAIEPHDVEAGTGFYEERFVRGEIDAEMGDIRLTKRDDGVSWGSVHWQYLEDISRVKPSRDNPLRIQKQLFRKVTTKKGQELQRLKGPLHVGDELVVRLELRSDRDLEYVHLKDQRGSGTEPVVSLSTYRWQDGLGYYDNPRDTASHFFIDTLRKGTYVFEYSVRVQLRGTYQSGMAQIQCMYAPEFNSHSESFGLVVE